MGKLPVFDLTQVMRRVAQETKWDKAQLVLAESEYREFLSICKAEPDASPSPTRNADQVWHAHILFTREYMRDMNGYFGKYLHHSPILKADDCSCRNDCCKACKGDFDKKNISADGYADCTRDSIAYLPIVEADFEARQSHEAAFRPETLTTNDR